MLQDTHKLKTTVVSLRITDEEREKLLAMVGDTNKSVSEILREALENFAATKGKKVKMSRTS